MSPSAKLSTSSNSSLTRHQKRVLNRFLSLALRFNSRFTKPRTERPSLFLPQGRRQVRKARLQSAGDLVITPSADELPALGGGRLVGEIWRAQRRCGGRRRSRP